MATKRSFLFRGASMVDNEQRHFLLTQQCAACMEQGVLSCSPAHARAGWGLHST